MAEAHVVRRQRRGQQRMEEILDAAVLIFSRVGVERATTNAIAAEAGVSPGSLYQYFGDKADIARALGRRYAEQVTVAHEQALAGFDHASAPLPTVLDRILDPIVAFKNAHPAFRVLFARPDLPPELVGPLAGVETGFTASISKIMELRNPHAAPADVELAAGTIVNLFRCVFGSLGSVSGDADVDLREVKRAMLGYLQECRLN